MDGELQLIDGTVVAVEIKLRMNWLKACQSGYQLSEYLSKSNPSGRPIKAGIVFFEQFSGDWARLVRSCSTERGWLKWYRNHHKIRDVDYHLVRFTRENGMQAYPYTK
jgi:hypothetical protein